MFQAIQVKIAEDNRQLVSLRSQIQSKEREQKMAELTSRELEHVPNDVRVYESVGKMHVPYLCAEV